MDRAVHPEAVPRTRISASLAPVIFDLDGALVETEELKAIAHTRSVTELHPEIPEEEGISSCGCDLVGHSRQEAAETLIQRFGLEEAARERMAELGEDEPWRALVHIRRTTYEELLKNSDLILEECYQHSTDLLEELRSQGYLAADATISHREQVRHMLSVLELEDACEIVVTMDDVERGKPGPQIDLLVAEKTGVPPEEFLVIEDSAAGVRAGVAAGMAVVAVPTKLTRNGLRTSDILEPRWVVADPGTLPDVVRRRIADAGGRREGDQ